MIVASLVVMIIFYASPSSKAKVNISIDYSRDYNLGIIMVSLIQQVNSCIISFKGRYTKKGLDMPDC